MSNTDQRRLAGLLCPGRGSYGREQLGWIRSCLDQRPDSDEGRALRDEVAAALSAADDLRRGDDRPTVTELDGAEAFRPGTHLNGRNAAELIYFGTMAQLPHLLERYRVQVIGGNSLGWYTALAAAGALSVADGWRLVETMARLQQSIGSGGQILMTTLGEDWQPDPELVRAVDDAVRERRDRSDDDWVARSIRLGGHEVIAGTDAGIQRLLQTLPKVERGGRTFPFQLAGHGPFHTQLCRPVAEQAREELKRLAFTQPRYHLVDGLGNQHSPWSADPEGLRRYTATTQVTDTYDFTASVRTIIREYQPDHLLCAGPGESLRAPVGHVVLRERWRQNSTRDQLFDSALVRTK